MRYLLTLTVGMALGATPAVALAGSNQVPASPPGPASTSTGTVSDVVIEKAGAALRDVSKLQQKYQGQMEAASPAQKRGLNEQANAETVQAIRSHGLSPHEYASVVGSAQNDPQIKQRLLDAAHNE